MVKVKIKKSVQWPGGVLTGIQSMEGTISEYAHKWGGEFLGELPKIPDDVEEVIEFTLKTAIMGDHKFHVYIFDVGNEKMIGWTRA